MKNKDPLFQAAVLELIAITHASLRRVMDKRSLYAIDARTVPEYR